MKRFTSKTQRIGEIGEQICLKHLELNDFKILETNYTKRCGEIDIVATKNNIIHFVEIKTSTIYENVSHETYNPAQNMTRSKIQKIQKTVEMYLGEKSVSYETLWQIDLYCVYIEKDSSNNRVEVLENIILD